MLTRGETLLVTGVQGTIHLGGSERSSRYEFGMLMAEVFELATDSIVASRRAAVQMTAPRPADVSLDSRRAFALGYSPGATREQLLGVKERMAGVLDAGD